MSAFQYYNEILSEDEDTDIEDSEEDYESTLLPQYKITQPKTTLMQKRFVRDNLLISNSADRNIDAGETTFNYTITFNESVAGSDAQRAFFNVSLKNIRSISIIDVIMPNFYLDVPLVQGLISKGQHYRPHETTATSFVSEYEDNRNIVRLPRVQDLPFILMKINQIGTDLKGTNSAINSSTCMLTIDQVRETTNNASGRFETATKNSNDTFLSGSSLGEIKLVQKGNVGQHNLAGTDKNILYFKNKMNIQKLFHPNPLGRLSDFKIEFFTNLGVPLTFQTDKLTIKDAFRASGSTFLLTIIFTTFFSPEEFRVGDNVIFKGVAFATRNVAAEAFLNRKEGHTILELPNEQRRSSTSGTYENYFKGFVIGLPVTVDLTNYFSAGNQAGGDSVFTLIVPGTLEYDADADGIPETFFSSGTCINQSMQHTISFNIQTEEYTYDSENTELI